MILFAIVVAQPLTVQGASSTSPWEKGSLDLGLFTAKTSTDIRFGSGLAISVNLEDALGMDAENQVFRLDGHWRFSENRRHRLDISWFSFKRTASNTILEDITIRPPGGGEITLPSGSVVKSYMDLEIYQLGYTFSFIQDNRLDLAGGGGLYIMPIGFGLDVKGLVDDEADQSFTAPMPVLSLIMDLVLAPKWFFRSRSQLFYIEYEKYTGSFLNIQSKVEYNPWKHVGLGLGVESLRMNLQADGEEVFSGFDLRGNIGFTYVGLFLYGRVYF